VPHIRKAALEQEDWRKREELAQMERMAVQIERFSAMHFFTVDRSTLLAVMSTVVTYLIIVLQEKK
jgi:7tm Chemosensory receptor